MAHVPAGMRTGNHRICKCNVAADTINLLYSFPFKFGYVIDIRYKCSEFNTFCGVLHGDIPYLATKLHHLVTVVLYLCYTNKRYFMF